MYNVISQKNLQKKVRRPSRIVKNPLKNFLYLRTFTKGFNELLVGQEMNAPFYRSHENLLWGHITTRQKKQLPDLLFSDIFIKIN